MQHGFNHHHMEITREEDRKQFKLTQHQVDGRTWKQETAFKKQVVWQLQHLHHRGKMATI